MSSLKKGNRVGIRSLFGTQVSAILNGDGVYRPAEIKQIVPQFGRDGYRLEFTELKIVPQKVYLVRISSHFCSNVRPRGCFDHIKHHWSDPFPFQEDEIIGQGFSSIGDAELVKNQKVFLTHNTREMTGIVQSHDSHSNDILVKIELPDGGHEETIVSLESIRLTERRKSTRLQNHVSSIIDVPNTRR